MVRRAQLVFAVLLLLTLPVGADEPFSKISGPVTQSNLSVFLLHGKDTISSGSKLLTLEEALDHKKLIVHETSDVNELAIENVSADVDVFVQSGDIVKGGRQDRVIACDMIVPPKSGKIPIGSFCCESGRWQQRGSENAAQFGESRKQVANKDVKLALNSSRDQGLVWSKVKEAQRKLTDNVGKPVANSQSPSSYQLTLEDKELLAKLEMYTKDMKKLAADNADAIGFVIVINGKPSGAEIYGSHALFFKLWPKLIEAAAVDALSEFDAKKNVTLPTDKDVAKFLADASKGNEKEIVASAASGRQLLANQSAVGDHDNQKQAPQTKGKPDDVNPPARVRVTSTDNDKTVLLEAKDRKDNSLVHRSYIAK
jgi:ARG/rhodanese/phosphatase superfamily protein